MDDRQGTRRHVQVFTDVLFRGKYLPSVKAVNAAVYYHMTQGMLELKDKVHILMATILVLGLLLFTAGALLDGRRRKPTTKPGSVILGTVVFHLALRPIAAFYERCQGLVS